MCSSKVFDSLLKDGLEDTSSTCCCCFPNTSSCCEDDVSDNATLKLYEILSLEQMKALLELAEVKVESLNGVTSENTSGLDDVLREKYARLRMLGAQEKLV